MKKVLSKCKYIIMCIVIIVVAVVSDQLSKYYMDGLLLNNKTIPVIGDWLVFHWTINHGGSFGMLNGANILFFVVTILGLPLFAVMSYRARTRSVWGQLGFSFMIGGSIGNAIDRAIFAETFFDGGVRDFVAVRGFAIFNVADSFLVVGVIMACIAIILADHDSLLGEIKKHKALQDSGNE